MHIKVRGAALCAVFICSMLPAAQAAPWWNPRWRLRTTVVRTTPYRHDTPRPVEVAVDFSQLLQRADVHGEFDPASLRVVQPGTGQRGGQVPFACRTEFNAREGHEQSCLAWMAGPRIGEVGRYDIYFDTKDRHIQAHDYHPDLLPPEDLLANAGFEEEAAGLPVGWTVEPKELVSLGRFERTTGERSLKIVVDENTPERRAAAAGPELLNELPEADIILEAELEDYGKAKGLAPVNLPEASGGQAMALGDETTGAGGQVKLEPGEYTLLVRAWGPTSEQDAFFVDIRGRRERRWAAGPKWTEVACSFKVGKTELVPIAIIGAEPGTCVDRIAVVRGTYRTPDGQGESIGRDVTISQSIDVRKFAGQEMVFECDLLAERAKYGAPVFVELQQFRADGSRILECPIQPRWLTVELAQGQLVQFSERGRFSHEAATADVRIRVRCYVKDADTGETVTGPEAFFTVWLDRVVVRPGERWPWPAASNAGFVEGALANAPLNRGFEFTGQRRLAFNGGSEGTLTASTYGDAKSVHWGLEAGTLEFWCKPSWDAEDGIEHIFFLGLAYGHRTQCLLRKLNAEGSNQLEFSIADAGGKRHTIRGPAPLRAGQWYHLAATWDFRKAHLQLFADGKPVAADGPSAEPWPSSLVHTSDPKAKGIGISEEDSRSMPMQAFIGGGSRCRESRSAEAVVDEFRISDLPRYGGDFTPARDEFEVDEHTRALFHLENERDGVHDADDRFVRGHLGCELEPQEQYAPLEVLTNGKVERRVALVKPYASIALFERNRAESRLTVTRPFRELPDPRFVEYRQRHVERTVTGADDEFALQVGGEFEPLMRSVTFQRADTAGAETTLLPRWRANDNVVPFSVESLAATLTTDARSDPEKAFEAFKYALQTTNYYDAHYCETLPSGRHRPRVSYTLTKALNIYPFDQCGPLNHILRKLFLAAGVSSNDASGTHHQFEQAFYHGSLRLFDLSPRIYWLERDNNTVVSRRGFEEDMYLKLRQGSTVSSALRGRRSRARFGTAVRPHSMDFPLRPGERASICWHNEGRWFEVTDKDRKAIPLAKIPPYFGNGAIIYQPTGEGEATALDNMEVGVTGDGSPLLRAQASAQAATLIYRAECPYILSDCRVSGAYSAEGAGAVSLSLSFDEGESWAEVWRSSSTSGQIAADLLEHVTARYAYWLRLELAAGKEAAVRDLEVRTTLVASPLALPGRLRLGENRISFVGGPVTVPVRTACTWRERHRSDLGVSLNAVSYYMNGDEAHRNLLVMAPGREAPVRVTLEGRRLRGWVALEGLPEGWAVGATEQTVEVADPGEPASVQFTVRPEGAPGAIRGFDVIVRERESERRVQAQVLVAEAALLSEAEDAVEVSGEVEPLGLGELSGARGVQFGGDGELAFDFTAPREDTYALWLRARWEPGSSTAVKLMLDEAEPRDLRATAMIGFTDWTSPRRAHTKMFAHFGEQYKFWSWYRVGDIELSGGDQRLTLAAHGGAQLDALALLPQDPAMDRAAMNLFQNWNYAPWDNPLPQAAHDEEVR